MTDDDPRRRRYDVQCDVHGDLGQVVGAYDASIVIDQHHRSNACTKAVANPARFRQRVVHRMPR